MFGQKLVLTSPLFIEVSVMYKIFTSFCNFSIRIWNCSDKCREVWYFWFFILFLAYSIVSGTVIVIRIWLYIFWIKILTVNIWKLNVYFFLCICQTLQRWTISSFFLAKYLKMCKTCSKLLENKGTLYLGCIFSVICLPCTFCALSDQSWILTNYHFTFQ